MPRPSALHDPLGPRYPDRQGHGLESGGPEWMEWVEAIDALKGYHICGRMNRFDEPCQRAANVGNARVDGKDKYGRPPCRHHGGRSLSGVANPRYIDGRKARSNPRYSLRGNMAAYNDRLDDLNYLSLQDEIALTEELIEQCVEVLDDPTPCPESWPEPSLPPEKDGKYSAEALERNANILQRDMEIAQWRAARAAATARFDSLMDTKAKLARTEIARVRAAADTLSGGMVRQFAQRLLEVNRRRFLDFGKQHGIPIEDVLSELADLQADFVSVVQTSRGTAGTRGANARGVDVDSANP
jgi:hypothetical protein